MGEVILKKLGVFGVLGVPKVGIPDNADLAEKLTLFCCDQKYQFHFLITLDGAKFFYRFKTLDFINLPTRG
jgi:hypothetical protein